jgi:GcrA cell cycle regulator
VLTSAKEALKEGRRMQSTDWTPEHAKALREYLAKGMSYSAIRDAINATFKTAFSRSATIGRVRRLKLAGPGRPDRSKPPPKVILPRLHRVRERGAAEMPWLPPTFKSVAMPKLRCADVVPRRLSLTDLERGDCRYPYGGDAEGEAITFCGHPRHPGSSYCAAHFDLSIGPGTTSERDAAQVLLKLVASHLRAPITSESIVPELADCIAWPTA